MSSPCGESCETSSWLGVSGVCDISSLRCICPRGYSGRDDWAEYNDCHVNLQVQDMMRIIFLVFNTITFCVSISSLVYLTFHWNFVPETAGRFGRRFSQHKLSSTTESGTSFTSMRSAEDRSLVRRQNEAYRRTRDTLMGICLFVVFTICSFIYLVPFFFGVYPDMIHSWYQRLGLFLSVNSVLTGLWIIVFVWYRNLPSLKTYARLFNINSILIKRPKLVRYTCYCHGILITLVTFVLLFLVPTLNTSKEVKEACDRAALFIIFVYITDFVVFLIMTITTLRQLFKEVRRVYCSALAEGKATAFIDGKLIDSTIDMTTYLLVNGYILGPVIMVQIAFMAFATQTNMYIMFNVFAYQGFFVTFVMFYVFFKYLKGDRANPATSAVAATPGEDEEELPSQTV